MRNKIRAVEFFILMIAITGCGAGGSSRSAWEQYDYRSTVTYDNDTGYTAPHYGYTGDMERDVEAKKQYYQDNDEYYTSPTDFGCSPDNPGMCN